MVKKLIKYEWLSYERTMLPMLIILLGIAVLNRFIQLFEVPDNTTYDIVFISSVVALVIAMIVCLVMSVAVAIMRFHKNLFTAEGYLSFTLPVTPTQHIFAKALMATVFVLLSLVAIVLAGSVALAGEPLVEVGKAIGYLANIFFEHFKGEGVVWVIEAILAVLATLVCEFLLFYACISIGQMARKNRVGAAFGVYFAYYFICQILGTVGILIIMAVEDTWWFEKMFDWIEFHPGDFLHIALIGWFVISCVLGAVYYLISGHIMKKKLNLE